MADKYPSGMLESTLVAKLPAGLRDYFAKLGRKGGGQRMSKLTPEQRQALAAKAARARWRKKAP